MKVVDPRSLLGAGALITTGVILAFMLNQYLTSSAIEGALSRSRLWWEIAMNLQVFCAASMWFCYSERIENSTGPVRRLQVMRLWFAIVTVLFPSILGFAGILNNWFEERPGSLTVIAFSGAILSYWLLGLWLHARMQKKRRSKLTAVGMRYRILFYIPALMLIMLILYDAPRGGQTWLLAIPILTYIQGAMPFFVKAFGLR